MGVMCKHIVALTIVYYDEAFWNQFDTGESQDREQPRADRGSLGTSGPPVGGRPDAAGRRPQAVMPPSRESHRLSDDLRLSFNC
jgi:hypothetical protein